MRARWQLAGVIFGAAGLVGCMGASPELFGELADESAEGTSVDDGDIATDYDAEGPDGTFITGGDGTSREGEVAAETERTCFLVQGNATCEDYRLGTELLRVNSVQSDTYASDAGTVTLTVSPDGTAVGFTSTMGIHAVIAKAGGYALVCEYAPETYADTSQEVAVTDLLLDPHPINRVVFCDLELSQIPPADPAG